MYQNEHNPFSDYTVIGFDMAKRGDVELRLFDVTGKVLRVIEGEYGAGYNEIRLNKSDVNMNGMIYYQLQTGDFSAVKHMIIIE